MCVRFWSGSSTKDLRLLLHVEVVWTHPSSANTFYGERSSKLEVGSWLQSLKSNRNHWTSGKLAFFKGKATAFQVYTRGIYSDQLFNVTVQKILIDLSHHYYSKAKVCFKTFRLVLVGWFHLHRSHQNE